ncbi:LOB domain-containing protein 38 [Gossypium raimondii]|uniref:LOB domain-containing protein n=1 Tax=Gossypium raimondii TaxID=29730 RepID=A0A0D2T2G2_GOSRA|nr:LOB domain-containing protein 38 [Gossypium raimondii]KJB48686.1 hypothetical protein B456_008G081100 [Gossypium raimondii]MBA0592135.1 hypothetical protein [Gossypium raimondii]
MSCNGCRVLRKGCSESCILRPCLQWIDSPEAQGHATIFVAKFFGRAGLMSFISAVPESQRSVLFQSLLFEACGRTVNPVNGAVGLLWTGNWHVCQAAVETVLRGGTVLAVPELMAPTPASGEKSEATKITCMLKLQETETKFNSTCRFSTSRSKVSPKRIKVEEFSKFQPSDLDLCLTPSSTGNRLPDNRRPGTPSLNSEESVTTTCFESGFADQQRQGGETDRIKLLNLFV